MFSPVPDDGLSGRADLDGVGEVSSAVVTAAVRLVAVDGAAVLLMSDRTRWRTAAATGDAVAAVADLEMTVGEGPSVEAYVTGGPVLVPDLASGAARWPILAAALPAACAYFSFPLRIGAVRFGVLDLHRRSPGRLDERSLATALRLADMAATALVHRPHPETMAEPASWLTPGTDFRPEIDQATGMLSVFLGVDIATAYARLRGHAFVAGLPLADVAAAVVAGTLHLDGEGEQSEDPDR